MLGVPTRALFTDTPPRAHIPWVERAGRVREVLEEYSHQEIGETAIGWVLSDLLANEVQAWANYPADALRDICERVGMDWLEVLP